MRARLAAGAALQLLLLSVPGLPPALARLPVLAAAAAPPAPAAAAVTAAVFTRPMYRVRAGDTLTGIAIRLCGPARDWTGLYASNRRIIGPNPDLIVPGQLLAVACYDPPVHAAALHGRASPSAADADGDRPGGAYGHPYLCGDGDGDGWDLPCGTAARPAVRSAVRVASSAGYGFVLSYGQLEQLWMRAGGPSWAASAAASVAECESGGNVYAHNPSGATGLFQILGSVVGGNLYDPYVNALNAVAKFRASGDTWAQWVCKP